MLPSIINVKTTPFSGQKMGTSGLRRKVKDVTQPNFFENFVQSIFNTILSDNDDDDDDDGKERRNITIVLGGDGRYWNDKALQKIFKIGAAAGVEKFVVGRGGILSTPAVSAMIRRRNAFGGIILTASHNPGGPDADFGIKYNISNGGPAPEKVTSDIFNCTKEITSYSYVDIPDISLSKLDEISFSSKDDNKFTISIVDSVEEYLSLMKTIFNWDAIGKLLSKPEFSILLDAMHGVTGEYIRRIFGEFGISDSNLLNSICKEDFNGGHPDPNLTYADELVGRMKSKEFSFGAAFDGDGDRNMILGPNGMFVTPSDSLGVIVHYASKGSISSYYTKEGGHPIVAVARSMPTSSSLNHVAKKLGIKMYEVPTGWKFFGNIMDHYSDKGSVICGEESFGTGSSHIREKDGIWAVLAWLSILSSTGKTMQEVLYDFWSEYGRNYYSRYDYEEVDSDAAKSMMKNLSNLQEEKSPLLGNTEFELDFCDDFEYIDPFDGSVSSHQGLRFVYKDGSRVIFRLSGTGSVGATIRMYVEKYEPPSGELNNDAQDMLSPLISLALSYSKLQEFTGHDKPSVIT